MVPKKAVVPQTSGVLNAVAFDGDVLGEVVLVGPGAGGNATASSVIADIVDRGTRPPDAGVRPAGHRAHALSEG